MIPGGCMVLTIYGRDENNDSSVKHSPTIWEFFGMMLNDMVLEVTTLVNHKGQDQCC
jgi:jasmonate O-methyltransferase